MNNKVVITGASGLLGSHFVLEFSQKYNEIVALYRTEKAISVIEKIFKYYNKIEFFDKVTWVKCDINNVKLLKNVTKNADLVIHSAALVSFEKEDIKKLNETNIEGTKNVLEAIKYSNVKTLIYISSVATIRNKNKGGYFVENGSVLGERAWTYYAKSKQTAEDLVLEYRNNGGKTVIINPGVILGPSNINNSSTAIFKTVKDGLKFYTTGINGFVDVRDVVYSCCKLLNIDNVKDRYICVGNNVSFKDVFKEIAKNLNINPPQIKATPYMLKIACFVEKIRAKITNVKPKITKENTSAAFLTMKYSSKLLKKDINIKFKTYKEAIENTANFLKFDT